MVGRLAARSCYHCSGWYAQNPVRKAINTPLLLAVFCYCAASLFLDFKPGFWSSMLIGVLFAAGISVLFLSPLIKVDAGESHAD
jgi:hypothetical protein